jgi:hypothetical protein
MWASAVQCQHRMPLHKSADQSILKKRREKAIFMQSDDLDVQDGRWWKFAQYSIANGCISPVPGSSCTRYDAWEPYWLAVSQRRTVRPPYLSLLELVRHMRFSGVRSPYLPTPESETLILDWVREWGLLGILPAVCESLTLPAPRQADGSYEYRRFVRRAGVWGQTCGQWAERGGHTGDRTPPGALSEPPGAVLWRWEKYDFTFEPLEQSVLDYLPATAYSGVGRNDLSIPRPCSESFWREYAEPICNFTRWAVRFCEAVEIAGNYGGPDLASKKELSSVNEALYFLEGLSQSIGTSAAFETGTSHLRRSMVSPSLLASFAEMALRDLENDRRARRCATCEAFFVSDDVRAQYCSPRCRNTMQRRRQRSVT